MKHTKTIRTISFEDLKHDSHLIDYVDENFIILDSMDYSGISPYETIKINSFMMAFCVDGEIDIHVNDRVHTLKSDHCVILLPNTIIRYLPHKKQCIFMHYLFFPLLVVSFFILFDFFKKNCQNVSRFQKKGVYIIGEHHF